MVGRRMNAMTEIPSGLRDMLDAAKRTAQNGGLPIRRKDGTLYKMLAECLAVCELVQAENREYELRELLRVSIDARNPAIWGQGRAASNNGKGRRYAERGSDAFILVCRYVLPDTESTAGRSRYSNALREAHKQGITSRDLVAWLTEHGGVNTLFKSRRVVASDVTTRTLHLNDAITAPKHGQFTVTLKMDHRGFFNVIEVKA